MITNVAFDHQHLLGDTIVLIAKKNELSKGVPVVLGATSEEVRCVVEETAYKKVLN